MCPKCAQLVSRLTTQLRSLRALTYAAFDVGCRATLISDIGCSSTTRRWLTDVRGGVIAICADAMTIDLPVVEEDLCIANA